MDKFSEVSALRNNQATCYRQILKSATDVVWASDVVNFTGLNRTQVIYAMKKLIEKGLVRNISRHTCERNSYVAV